MAHFSSDFTSSVANTQDSEAQQVETSQTDPRGFYDPSLLEGPVSQPGRGGLLRRIELRIGSVS